MLTDRQQHCLSGIGIQQWKARPSTGRADITALPSEQDTLIEPPISLDEKAVSKPSPATQDINDWQQFQEAVNACSQCELAQTCNQKVAGKGAQQADLLIIGEAPGHDEDIHGIPFVGRAGQLLDKMLSAIQLNLNNVYITNILKCRPPNNRDPKVDEIRSCSRFLKVQIKLVQPKVILSVGRISAQNLLGVQGTLGSLRQHRHLLPDTNIPLLVTYHPAYLLRNPPEKTKSWEDLKALYQLLNNAAD